MRLRTKTIAVIGLMLVVVLLILYPLQQWWMTNSFAGIEQQDVRSEINHTINGINYDLMTLRNVSSDYASWDDTYFFVQDGDEQYARANLVPSTFVNQRLSAIVIANATGGILYARCYDPAQDNLTDIPGSLAALLVPGSPMLPTPGRSTLGFVALPEGLMMVSAVPVLRSDTTGPPMGTMVMGRYFDRSEIDMIDSISGTSMSLSPWEPGSAPPADSLPRISVAGDDISGQSVIEDIYGQPAAVLGVTMPRPYAAEEQSSMVFYTAGMFGGGIICGLIIILLLEGTVLSPVLKLSESVEQIGSDQDLSRRVAASGDDEIAQLAATINRMLDALEASRQQLQDSEQRMRNMVENVNEVVWEADVDAKLTYVSPKARDILGYDPGEILGRTPYDLVQPADRDQIRAGILDMLARRGTFSHVTFWLVRPDGSRVYIEVGGNPFCGGPDGKIVGYRGIARDITERWQAFEALRLSERRQADIINHLPDATFAIDRDGKVIAWNRAIEEMTGRAAADMLGKGDYEYAIPFYGIRRPILTDLIFKTDDEIRQGHYINVKREGFALMAETPLPRPKGKNTYIWAKASPLYDEKGEIVGAIESIRDITENKRAEDQIRASLAEKDVLLKEIHHRVKNNLQIISSLLSLQSEKIRNGDQARTFRESQDRIRSMALIHEMLYQSKDIARIDFAEYVRSLTASLVRSYSTGYGVRTVVDIAGVSLGIDTAIPCGLIINELVSNALKYAFPGGRPGEVRIGLARADGRLALTVADDGVGLPSDLDFRATGTLGLQLVNTLVGQLEGSISVESAGGTLVRITFPDRP